MEAKDTVMTQGEIDIVDEQDVVDGDIVPYLNAQAEISFKAGYKQGVKDNYDCGVEDRKLGIREVVEWIRDNDLLELGVSEHYYIDWQAKLKEWGIEEVK